MLLRGEITGVPSHQGVNPIKRVGPLGLAILCVTAFLVIARWLPSQSGLVPSTGDSVWNVIVLGFPFFVPFGINWYRRLIDKEKEIGKEEPGRELEEVFWATWLPMIFMFCAIITASLELAVAAHITSPLSFANNALRTQYSLMLVGLVVAIGLPLFAVHESSRRDESKLSKDELWTLHPSHPGTSNHLADPEMKTRPEPAFQPRVSTTLLLIGGVAAWALWPWVSTIITIGSVGLSGPVGPRWLPQWLFYTLGCLGALWLGFITIDSIHVNIARLEFYRFAWRAWLVSVACGASIASNWIWLWIIGIWANGEWAPVVEVIASISIVSFGGTLVIETSVWKLARSFLRMRKGTDASYLALHHPVANIFQDQVLYAFSLAILLFTAFAVDSLSTMKDIHISEVTLICALISLLITLAMVIPAFISSTKNAEGHIDREVARPPSKAMYERVGSCDKCVEELRQERLKRMRKRWNYICYSSLLVLPIGLLLVVPLFIDRINKYFSSSED